MSFAIKAETTINLTVTVDHDSTEEFADQAAHKSKDYQEETAGSTP